jgi:hypothetical protein
MFSGAPSTVQRWCDSSLGSSSIPILVRSCVRLPSHHLFLPTHGSVRLRCQKAPASGLSSHVRFQPSIDRIRLSWRGRNRLPEEFGWLYSVSS